VARDEIVLLPAVPHGYSPHHMDFPGTITIGWDTFARYLTDIGTSLARHGFRRLLYLNGHGSNQNLVETAARLVGVEYPEVLAAAAFHSSSGATQRTIAELRDSGPGGMAHARELETSMYLAIDSGAVDMAKAVDERGYPAGEHASMDWTDGPLKLMPWWSSFSRTGVQGDPTKVTAEKGHALLEAAVAECVAYVHELRAKPIPGPPGAERDAAVKATRFGRPLQPGGTIGVHAPVRQAERDHRRELRRPVRRRIALGVLGQPGCGLRASSRPRAGSRSALSL